MKKASSTAPKIGQLLAGKYRVEKVLGSGGMGTVVAAMHLDLQELRAIKLMHEEHAGDATSVERFLREARAAVRLGSEHVARVLDFGRLESGVPYIVMEHLTGSDLGEVSKRRGPLPIEEAALYVAQAASAVAEAHEKGIVHRDLKPSNLFLTTTRNGSPCIKVLDFGISKLAGPGSDGQLDMTKPGELVGSPLFMAPEQMRSCHVADARSDVWGLGVILYKLVTGRLPFFARGLLEVCTAVIEQPPAMPRTLRPDMPRELEALILRCLAKDPADRLGGAAELATALAPFTERRASEERISIDVVIEPDPPHSAKAQTAGFEVVEIDPVWVEPVQEPEAPRVEASIAFSLSRRRRGPPAPVKRRARSPLAIAVSVIAGVIMSAVTLASSGTLVTQDQRLVDVRAVKLVRAAAAAAALSGADDPPIQPRASAPLACPTAPQRLAYVPGGPDDPFRLLDRSTP